MKKFVTKSVWVPAFVAVLLIVFTFVIAAAEGPAKPAISTNQAGGTVETTLGTLYSQTDSPSSNGAPAQNFEAAFNIYDNEGADDFVVPANTQWDVDGVVIIGTQSTGGTPASVNVAFYADDATFPAATPTCNYANVATFTGNTTINVTLPSVCSLTPGNWWVAFSVNQNFNPSGQYFWSNRTVQSNNGGVWRNPGGGFGTSCANWDRQTTCGVGGGTNPDFLFQILGTAGPVVQPAIDVALTVSTDGSCGTSSNITADYGATITNCYQVENTGNVTLTEHTVVDSILGTVLGPNASYSLAPGATFSFTQDYTLDSTAVTTVMTWTAGAGQVSASGTATATVTGQPTDVTLSTFTGQSTSPVVYAAAALMLIFGVAFVARRRLS